MTSKYALVACAALAAASCAQAEPEARQTSPWLRSLSGEREADVRRKHGISGIERVLVITVVLAVLAFEVWFFFFAGSSLPNA